MDWEAEGLLDGLEGEAREARRALLDELRDAGASAEELRAAVAEDRLVLLPIERALLSTPRYTLAEVAERSGTPADMVEARMRMMGLHVPEDPTVAAFSDEDVEAAVRARQYVERGIGLEAGRSVMHILSGSMAKAAEPMRRLFASSFLQAGDSEYDLGRRYARKADELLPLVSADLDYLLRRHLRDFARHDAIGLSERLSGALPETVDVGVAFADIVGFTRLGEEVAEVELTDIAERLDELATEHIRRPARVVKTIGDAVMVVSPDVGVLADSVLDLMDGATAADGFPPLRAGMAYGRAVGRLGDWFGPTVNLASRVTARARPEAVLVTNAVRDALGEDAGRYRFSEAGHKRLKGIGEPVGVLRMRRGE